MSFPITQKSERDYIIGHKISLPKNMNYKSFNERYQNQFIFVHYMIDCPIWSNIIPLKRDNNIKITSSL